MRAAAQFHGVAIERAAFAADLHDAHGVAVFVAKKLHDVITRRHFAVRHLGPADDGIIKMRSLTSVSMSVSCWVVSAWLLKSNVNLSGPT